MNDITAELDDFLVRYAGALASFDAEAAAALWGAPGMILDDRSVGVVETREAMVDGLKRSYPLYRRLGLTAVGHELLSRDQLSDAVFLVRVRWLFYDGDGDLMTDSFGSYLLRRDADGAGLRAFVYVPVDDAEKLRELAVRKGIDLTGE
ncbi:hypothetical protein [Streptomyces sp. NPDC047974]|uniref:hypothetical protein n=1 Tax=Streptomyces sp. NPDC047974 TaxID=3154343 RepID=UPI00340C0F8E